MVGIWDEFSGTRLRLPAALAAGAYVVEVTDTSGKVEVITLIATGR